MQPSLASRLRLALLMVLGVYPLITLYLYAIFPLTDGWQLWQRTMVLVPLMVVSIVFGLMPFIQKRFGGFIAGRRPAPAPQPNAQPAE
jgi:antibiotic biosynthesis monooxygenase (ABM) superfamily enzyme